MSPAAAPPAHVRGCWLGPSPSAARQARHNIRLCCHQPAQGAVCAVGQEAAPRTPARSSGVATPWLRVTAPAAAATHQEQHGGSSWGNLRLPLTLRFVCYASRPWQLQGCGSATLSHRCLQVVTATAAVILGRGCSWVGGLVAAVPAGVQCELNAVLVVISCVMVCGSVVCTGGRGTRRDSRVCRGGVAHLLLLNSFQSC
jgi:hypothetical protein